MFSPTLALGSFAVTAAIVAGGALYMHHKGYTEGVAEVQAKWDTDINARAVDAAKRTAEIAQDFEATKRAKDATIATITSRLNDTLSKLRIARTATRLSSVAAANCAGATGAELSGPDAAFLAGFAARAERQRADLAACYEEVNAVRQRFSAGNAAVSAAP